MKHLFSWAALSVGLFMSQYAIAWDGFDADTTDLVEITPDKLPKAGDTVDVRNYESDTSQTCLVEAVSRNTRTVEVVVRAPGGQMRTLVMEGR
ncbi:MAG: DUF5334 family protein [Desulfovibrio sp.]|nr:DUF5334 family protein [Desulfovibrio sp.]